MNPFNTVHQHDGLTLRQAALIASFAYLLMPLTVAEFYINPKLLIAGNIDQTAQNIIAHGKLFSAAILCYLITPTSLRNCSILCDRASVTWNLSVRWIRMTLMLMN